MIEISAILRENDGLQDKFREIINENIKTAEEFIMLNEANTTSDSLLKIINILSVLKSKGSLKLAGDIDFVIRGIEEGYLLDGIGIRVK
ncbi:MAG: hypothetical protein NTV89_17530 [Proteobacteria bacterium]|nr:hypothetical protein [Pseudomonadota bacterium]